VSITPSIGAVSAIRPPPLTSTVLHRRVTAQGRQARAGPFQFGPGLFIRGPCGLQILHSAAARADDMLRSVILRTGLHQSRARLVLVRTGLRHVAGHDDGQHLSRPDMCAGDDIQPRDPSRQRRQQVDTTRGLRRDFAWCVDIMRARPNGDCIYPQTRYQRRCGIDSQIPILFTMHALRFGTLRTSNGDEDDYRDKGKPEQLVDATKVAALHAFFIQE
jgi:hypothetical protein